MRVRPFPFADILFERYHADAIHRTGRKAEFTAGTFTLDDCVHLLGRTEYGVYRAGLDTQGAANADLFIDNGVAFFLVDTVFGIEWFRIDTE